MDVVVGGKARATITVPFRFRWLYNQNVADTINKCLECTTAKINVFDTQGYFLKRQTTTYCEDIIIRGKKFFYFADIIMYSSMPLTKHDCFLTFDYLVNFKPLVV